jgi:hypothetical protein
MIADSNGLPGASPKSATRLKADANRQGARRHIELDRRHVPI